MVIEVSAIEVASTTLRRPGARRRDGAVLLFARERPVKRHHLGRRIEPAFELRRGAADFRGAGQERQHRARLGAQRARNRIRHLRLDRPRVAAEIARLHRKGAAFARHHRRIAQKLCHPRAVDRRRHDEQPQILAQALLHVARQRQPEIGVERALVEFVEQDGGDALEHRIVEDKPREHALGDDLDPRARRHFGAEAHPQAHRVADLLAERLGHALGGGPRCQPPGFQHQDARLFFRRHAAQGSSARTSGTRVVLPAPGGATSTAVLRARNAAVSSGSAASIGSGGLNVGNLAVVIAAPDPAIHAAALRHGPLRHRRRSGAALRRTAMPGVAKAGICRPYLSTGACQFVSGDYITSIMPTAQKSTPAAKGAAPAAAKPPKQGDHVFLVDGSGYIFRAYHALPPINRKSDGLQLNAVFGFCNMLWKLLRDMTPEERPTHLAVIFDKSEKTFRTAMYPDYKAHRPDPPDDLKPQFKYVREAVQAFDLPCLEQDGFEADDLIATYVREAREAGATATIVSSDKDLMQLVADGVVMFDTMKDKKIGRAEVIEKFGVPPEKVIDVQSLIGDSTDNVPGVPGIGVKTAAQLIVEYGDLETLLFRAPEIKQDKRRQIADRPRRGRAHVQEARHARRSRQARRADRRSRRARARLQKAGRLPQGDGIQRPDAPRGGIFEHRPRRDRGRSAVRRPGRESADTFPPMLCNRPPRRVRAAPPHRLRACVRNARASRNWRCS